MSNWVDVTGGRAWSCQLADECREILEHAIDVRDFYRENMKVVLKAQPQKAEQVEADMEAFETDMKNVLKVRGSSGVSFSLMLNV